MGRGTRGAGARRCGRCGSGARLAEGGVRAHILAAGAARLGDTTRELKTALDHWTAGRRGAARDLLKRLVAKDPKHPGVNQLYAVALAEEKEFERAIYYMERAIAADPG